MKKVSKKLLGLAGMSLVAVLLLPSQVVRAEYYDGTTTPSKTVDMGDDLVVIGDDTNPAFAAMPTGREINRLIEKFKYERAHIMGDSEIASIGFDTTDDSCREVEFLSSRTAPKGLNSSVKVNDQITLYYDFAKEKAIFYTPCLSFVFNKDSSGMFKGQAAITSINFGNKVDTSVVENFSSMFEGCTSLVKISGKDFNTRASKNFNSMFKDCTSLKNLDISSYEISKNAKVDGFFTNDTKLETLVAPKLIVNGTIGLPRRFYVDDNKDEFADTGFAVQVLTATNVSHRYIEESKVKNSTGPVVIDPVKPDPEKPSPVNPTPDKTGPANPGTTNQTVGTANETFPKNVTVNGVTYTIGADGNAAVTKIKGTKKVNLNTVRVGDKEYPVRTIASGACVKNKKIAKVTIGSNVTKIEKKAFCNCKNLKKITINANKSLKIQKKAFSKIAKDRTVSIKGVKGKAKSKLMKNF